MADQQTNLQNADIGPRVVGQSIYEESSTAKCKLGARLVLGDRVFRYCKNGSIALAAGKLLQSASTYGFGETQQNGTVATTGAAGSNSIVVTLSGTSTLTLDALKDGYLGVYDGTGGVGQTYRIKGNTAAGVTSNTTITLYDQIVTAIVTTDMTTLTKSPFGAVVVAATTLTGIPIGVPLIAITANYYFWSQTWGPVTCLVGTTTLGANIVVANSAATAGALIPVDSTAAQAVRVGFAMGPAGMTASKYGLVFLQIIP